MLHGYQCLADDCHELMVLTRHIREEDLLGCPVCGCCDVVYQGEYTIGRLEPMQTIREIQTGTTEGRLLLAAIAVITTLPGYTNKTPDEALEAVKQTADKMYVGEDNVLHTREEVVKLLADLLGRLEGCPNPGCAVCKSIKAQVTQLCNLLGLDADMVQQIMPRHLRER